MRIILLSSLYLILYLVPTTIIAQNQTIVFQDYFGNKLLKDTINVALLAEGDTLKFELYQGNQHSLALPPSFCGILEAKLNSTDSTYK
jgi:hypothetical protein